MLDKKYIYFFGGSEAEGNKNMKELLGGKGANLSEMVNLGFPVPAGFTISTDVCTYFYKNNRKYPDVLEYELNNSLKKVENVMDAKYGDTENPLLLSVRSGARASMPGMMDTVLNIGLTSKTIPGFIKRTGNERMVWDSYRRFVQMYGDVVLGLKPETEDEEGPFEVIISGLKRERGIKFDTDFSTGDLKLLSEKFKEEIKKRKGRELPDNHMEQLWGAISAVFNSWDNARAIAYRKLNNIPDDWGTAVNVQSMVFGNTGEDSGTGVAFTRDPATGEKIFYGEFLMNAQGEDVVAGIRTPLPIEMLESKNKNAYDQLIKICGILEKHYKDMQDLEFTIEKGKLWMLQTRAGKRTGLASVRIAIEMQTEALINKEEAMLRIEPRQLEQLLRPVFNINEKRKAINVQGRLLARGLNAGPGAASGQVVFNAADAVKWAEQGKDVILVRIETSPEDIKGMDKALGILTARGGMTSHAALVARQMGKVCVAGCGALEIDYRNRQFTAGTRVINEGNYISLDGTTGEVIEGRLETNPSEVIQVLIDKTFKPEESHTYKMYDMLMSWASEIWEKDIPKMGVRTNADRPGQAETAVALGAEGIGLCRTEHMFFEGDRISAMREMILADNLAGRKKALATLLPIQKEDFKGIFRVMNGLPVTIRTLDPPLHEFLPHQEKEQREIASKMGVEIEKIQKRIEELKEANPMLGHRGCRLGIVYPEITEMQARAIIEAACEVKKEGIEVNPEIMIPLVGHINELKNQRELVDNVAGEVMKEQGVNVKYLVGTMIELPRAALTANEIASVAEFFSFGTNDLTQTTFGLSRDDAGTFLPIYQRMEILRGDPFETLDQQGVGQLVTIGVEKGRKTNPKLKVGICGEHGGDPDSVEFCYRNSLNYVSCSPFRVPIARLAAARAAIKALRNK